MTSKMVPANRAKNDVVFALPIMFAAPSTDMGIAVTQSNGMQPFNGQQYQNSQLLLKGQQQSNGELVQAPPQQHHDHQSCHRLLHEQQALLHKQHEQLSDLQKRLQKSEDQLKHIREQLRQNKGRGERKGNNNLLSRLHRKNGKDESHQKSQPLLQKQSTPQPTQLVPPQEQQLEKERRNNFKGQGQGNNSSQNGPRDNPHSRQKNQPLSQKQPPPPPPSQPQPVEQRLPPAASELQPSRDVRPQGVPQVGKKTELLTIPMINEALMMLDQELGKQKSIKMPVQMVVLGGALAMYKFHSRDATEAIDVILDPRLRKCQAGIRYCIGQVAKTSSKVGHGWMTTDHYERYFTPKALDKVFHQCAGDQKKKPELYHGTNLRVYAIDTKVALEMKMRRMIEQKRYNDFDLKDVIKFQGELRQNGVDMSYNQCRTWNSGGKGAEIPVEKLEEKLREFTKTREIVKK